MLLESLYLSNIRRHTSLDLTFSSKTTVVIGDNALGKTTLAEAVHLLSMGESFRADVIDEVIQFSAELGRIKGIVRQENDEIQELEVILTRGLVQGKRTAKRLFSLNGVRRRRKDVVGQLLSVIFRPEDMRLIEGSPSRRRSFMDAPLIAISQNYAHALHQYEQTLIRRNKLLHSVKEGEQSRTALHYWNLSLIKHGELLQKERSKLFQTFILLEFPVTYSVEYKPSIISAERQEEYLDREIASGRTLIGPHKDDFDVILHNWRGDDLQDQMSDNQKFSVARYGSRGQQRLAVLWLKLCELQFLESSRNDKPVLVLDDIFSELDSESKKVVLNLLQGYQTIVTTTQKSDVESIKSDIDETETNIVLLN